jgi:hypothetical protein
MKQVITLALTIALATSAASAAAPTAQNPFGDLQQSPAGAKAAAVTYVFPEQITVPANKATAVDLHFKVADGLHVNSHTPSEEELIPTTLKLPDTPGVRFANVTYPAGKDYSFANSKEKLSVYTGDFTLRAEVTASRGEHLVETTLHFQACNNHSCMPPRNIPVAIDVIAK